MARRDGEAVFASSTNLSLQKPKGGDMIWLKENHEWLGFYVELAPSPDCAPLVFWGRVFVWQCPIWCRAWWLADPIRQEGVFDYGFKFKQVLVLSPPPPNSSNENRESGLWIQRYIHEPVVARNVRLLPFDVAANENGLQWLAYFLKTTPSRHGAVLVAEDSQIVNPPELVGPGAYAREFKETLCGGMGLENYYSTLPLERSRSLKNWEKIYQFFVSETKQNDYDGTE